MHGAAAKSLQSCPTLCDPIDGSPPGSLVPEILQARTMEWVSISFSNVWKWKVKVTLLSRVWLLATPWTAVHQAPPPMGFSRQEYWSGVPLPSPWYMHKNKLNTVMFEEAKQPISFSSAWKWKVKVKSLSHVWLLATPWTAAYQAPPPMGFSR